ARKLGQDCIAGGVEHAAAAASDEILEHRPIGGEPAQGFFLVLSDELAVAENIGSQDGGDLAFHVRPTLENNLLPRASLAWVQGRATYARCGGAMPRQSAALSVTIAAFRACSALLATIMNTLACVLRRARPRQETQRYGCKRRPDR